MPKISVRVVPETSTSASMRPLRSAIFLSSVRTLSAAPQTPSAGGGGPRRRPGLVCRARCARPDRPRASGPPRRGGGPAGARGGCLERPGALAHQVFAPLGKQAQRLRCGLGIHRRQPQPAKLESTRTLAESLGATMNTGVMPRTRVSMRSWSHARGRPIPWCRNLSHAGRSHTNVHLPWRATSRRLGRVIGSQSIRS